MDVAGWFPRSRKGKTAIWVALSWLVAWAFSLSIYAITDDHFDRLSRARQIARHGELPFADFFDPGYFLGELTSAGLQVVLGDSFLGEALLTSSCIAAGSVIVFFLARRFTTPAWALVVAIVAALVLPRPYDYDKVAFFPLGLLLA